MTEEKIVADQNDAAVPASNAGADGSSKFQSAREFVGRNITLTIKEWIYALLNQPTDPPFRFDADFKDELGRVVRLIVAVLTISGIMVGGLNIFTGKVDMVQLVKDTVTVFVIAILVSLIFLPSFYICGVRVISKTKKGDRKHLNIGQVFFTVLYTFVPWLPVLVFIRASVTAAEGIFLIDFLLIAPILCLLYMLVNFSKSMKVITNCPVYRIWGGVSIPFLLILAYLIF